MATVSSAGLTVMASVNSTEGENSVAIKTQAVEAVEFQMFQVGPVRQDATRLP